MKSASAPTEGRLRLALLVFLVVLSVPSGLLVYRAWHQVQAQVIHDYRLSAERMLGVVDARLREQVAREEARRFDDYRFYLPDGGGARSPLSRVPVEAGLPGLVGHFQIDSQGRYTTPLLPEGSTGRGRAPLDEDALIIRQGLDTRIREVLSAPQTQLAVPRSDAPHRDSEASASVRASNAPAATTANAFDRLSKAVGQRAATSGNYGRVDAIGLDASMGKKGDEAAVAYAPLVRQARERRKEQRAVPAPPVAATSRYTPEIPTEAVLADKLRLADSVEDPAAIGDTAPSEESEPDAEPVQDSTESLVDYGRALETDSVAASVAPFAPALAPQVPEPETAETVSRRLLSRPASPGRAPSEAVDSDMTAPEPIRIHLFESEIDPMNFAPLDARYFVLFRNVWRNGERFIQGALIEREPFFEQAFRVPWRASRLAPDTRMLIAWSGEILAFGHEASARAALPRGEDVLYRTRLSAPLSELEILMSAERLPLGAAGRYLMWVSLSLAMLLVAGGYAFYRYSLVHLRLSRQQQDFVSAVSHELKTPLTSIRMYSEMLVAGWGDDAKRQGWFRFIHDESERLSRLIDNVLQLARLSRGHAPLQLQSHVVGDLLSRAQPRLEAQVKANGFALDTDIEPGALALRLDADEDAFTQVLTNLLDNAMKFTPEGAGRRVSLSARRDSENELVFTVRDFGSGIERAQMRRIFDLFYRAENELTRETVGTGIGLALVRQLVEAMAGRIDVTNRHPGAAFSIHLPCTEPVAGSD